MHNYPTTNAEEVWWKGNESKEGAKRKEGSERDSEELWFCFIFVLRTYSSLKFEPNPEKKWKKHESVHYYALYIRF